MTDPAVLELAVWARRAFRSRLKDMPPDEAAAVVLATAAQAVARELAEGEFSSALARAPAGPADR